MPLLSQIAIWLQGWSNKTGARAGIQNLPSCTKESATKALFEKAVSAFSVPGDPEFVLGGLVSHPGSSDEAGAPLPYLNACVLLVSRTLPSVHLRTGHGMNSKGGASGLQIRFYALALARLVAHDIWPADRTRAYLTALRKELGASLVSRIFRDSQAPCKYWMAFASRKPFDKALVE